MADSDITVQQRSTDFSGNCLWDSLPVAVCIDVLARLTHLELVPMSLACHRWRTVVQSSVTGLTPRSVLVGIDHRPVASQINPSNSYHSQITRHGVHHLCTPHEQCACTCMYVSHRLGLVTAAVASLGQTLPCALPQAEAELY